MGKCKVNKIFMRKKKDKSVRINETIRAPESSWIVLTTPTLKIFWQR
jgi:hypothetical protein